MALTNTKTAGAASTVPANIGSLRAAALRITFDSSYPTGGEAITATELGFSSIFAIVIGASTAGAHYAVYNDATGKILVFTAADGLQVADTTNIATVVFPALVIGV